MENNSFNWNGCVEAMSDDDCKRMAEERGFRVEFCYWMRAAKLVGLHKGEFAFPVHAPGGDVVGCHHRVSEGRWKFDPKGNPMSPLVIGNLATARTVLVFESQWDALTFMERMAWDMNETQWAAFAILITRGAANGRRVRGLIPEAALVMVVMQNDPPKEDGSPGAADKWLADVVEAVGRPVYLLQPPPEHKDLNDWTKAGAGLEEHPQPLRGHVLHQQAWLNQLHLDFIELRFQPLELVEQYDLTLRT